MSEQSGYRESGLLEKLTLRQQVENVRRLLKLLLSLDPYFLARYAGIAFVAAAMNYGGMLLSAYVLNSIAAGFVLERLLRNIILGLVFISLGGSFYHFLSRSAGIRESLLHERYEALRQEKIMEMDFSLIDSPRLKEIRQRISVDNNWGAGINSMFWQTKALLDDVVSLVGALAVGFPVFQYFRGKAGIFAGVAGVVLAACVAIGLKGRQSLKRITLYTMFHVTTKEERKKLYDYTWEFAFGWGAYRYENGRDVRIYDGYDTMKKWSYDKQQSKEFMDFYARRPAVADAGDSAVGSAMYVLGMVVSYLVVIQAAVCGGMMPGSVVLYAGCLANIVQGIVSLLQNCQEISMTARKQVGILELLELSDEMYKGTLPMEKRSDNQYEIEFRNVSFHYPGQEEYALKNFSMKLRVGEKLAIVGRNGSGKTTMIKLLCRLYDPQEGEILLNGVDIRKFRHEEYWRLFAVVFQDFRLLSLMLAENVAVGKEYDAERVRRYLRDVGFGERLEQLDAGVESYLYKDYTDEGIEISGGEAQKIAIARAIYRDAAFVLLDEPTAALDPIAESEIYENFDRIAGDKTAVYISHRLSSCKFCDRIAVFEGGRLVQTGSHEELLADPGGAYARLWNAQARYYEWNEEGQEA